MVRADIRLTLGRDIESSNSYKSAKFTVIQTFN